jgi:hypothetical protein
MRFDVARTIIQRRLKKGWVPPAQVPRKPRATLPMPVAPAAARRNTNAALAAAPCAATPVPRSTDFPTTFAPRYHIALLAAWPGC